MSRERGLVFGALGVLALVTTLAVHSALGTTSPTSGVAAARATVVNANADSVRIAGATIVVTRKGGGACYRAPHHASGCATRLAADRISYALGHDGKRAVIAGVAGRSVRAVIARLSHGGTVWPKLENGVFYADLPLGYRLRSLVKVLAGGRRVSFRVRS